MRGRVVELQLGDIARRRGEGQRAVALDASGLEMYGQRRDTMATALCQVGPASLAVEATLPPVERAALDGDARAQTSLRESRALAQAMHWAVEHCHT